MLGGLGIVIAAIVFFGWRKSTKQWQRITAWIAGIWALLSIGIIVFVMILSAFAQY